MPRLALHPKYIPDGIVVRLFYHRHGQRPAFTGRCIGLAQIKVHNQSIVAATDQRIRALGIESQAREGRWRQQLHERRVGIGNVPNERRGGHVGIDQPLVLKAVDGIRHGDPAPLGMPIDRRCRPPNVAGIAKDGHSLGRWCLRPVLRSTATAAIVHGSLAISIGTIRRRRRRGTAILRKVLLVQVDGVVLPHALHDDGPQHPDGVLVLLVLLRLLPIPRHVALLRRVDVLGPPPLHVMHAGAGGGNPLRVHLALGHGRGRADPD
mmetsp:Transcript_1048/g.2929  ORF Transcript_1048/g.2929 Transcript_1048/m.2929 type:complete len:265 (-) Transcript_1048:479-1273(-)